MQPHHTLMVKVKDGEIVDHVTIPNNEWGKYRKSGWQFATSEQVADYNAMMAQRAADAAEEKRLRRLEGDPDPDADDQDKTGDGPLAKKKAPAKSKPS